LYADDMSFSASVGNLQRCMIWVIKWFCNWYFI